MAEAAVEIPTNNNKFYCHQCSIQIKPKLPDFTCPECDNGFIEEVTAEEEAPTSSSATTSQTNADPATQFAELWGRAFLESFRNHAAERDEGVAWARDRDSDDEEQEGSSRRQNRAFQPPPRVSFRRTRPMRNQYLQGLFQYLSDRIDSDLGGGIGGVSMPGIPIVCNQCRPTSDNFQGSYLIQLLNQLEGSGAPPAQKEKIDSLPASKITQTQVDNHVQCSVCMDDFKLDEEVVKLPCDHHYHRDCIVPWLRLHGTCPVCRKDLNGEDVSLKEGIAPIVDDDSPISDSSSDMT